MARIQSFAPIAGAAAHTLILGSMPSRASLQENRYYAHPRNAFWPILRELLNVGKDASYASGVRAMRAAGIALWDVIHACARKGSLDSLILPGSVTINDFTSFFRSHRRIARVFFNGGTAELLFRRHVLHRLDYPPSQLIRLPSTSPANAVLSLDRKLEAWRQIVQPVTVNRPAPPLPASRLRRRRSTGASTST
ncbi:MAG: DNA-deoxyinosine glycosylase [Gammaproteobacteria bacterium]|nr:DNA-deoxyinosine glycosylase [Gammaproteobacteria bacterium]